MVLAALFLSEPPVGYEASVHPGRAVLDSATEKGMFWREVKVPAPSTRLETSPPVLSIVSLHYDIWPRRVGCRPQLLHPPFTGVGWTALA